MLSYRAELRGTDVLFVQGAVYSLYKTEYHSVLELVTF